MHPLTAQLDKAVKAAEAALDKHKGVASPMAQLDIVFALKGLLKAVHDFAAVAGKQGKQTSKGFPVLSEWWSSK